MNISIRTSISGPYQANMAAFGGSGMRSVLLVMARELERISKANFGPEGLDRPSQWAELSPPYRRWKGRHYGRTQADLILTGALRNSIRSQCNNDSFSEVIAGEGLDYAVAHQMGNSRLPARPFLPIKSSLKPTFYAQRRLQAVAESEIRKLLGAR